MLVDIINKLSPIVLNALFIIIGLILLLVVITILTSTINGKGIILKLTRKGFIIGNKNNIHKSIENIIQHGGSTFASFKDYMDIYIGT